jgi:hypothetical protein
MCSKLSMQEAGNMLNNSHHTLNLKKQVASVRVEALEQSRLNTWQPLMIALLAAGTLLVVGMALAAASDGLIWLAMWGWVWGWPLARKYSWNGTYTWNGKYSRNRKYAWNSKYSWNGFVDWRSRLDIFSTFLSQTHWVNDAP